MHLQSRLLATILSLELDREREQRRAERAETDATRDALTGLANRRAWDTVLAAEETRCRRYGHPASVLVVDLNGLKAANDVSGHTAGDRLLTATGQVLLGAARDTDVVARLGGDEFGVLMVETDNTGAQATAARIRQALDDAGIAAAVGTGIRSPDSSLTAAWEQADQAMYDDKPAGAVELRYSLTHPSAARHIALRTPRHLPLKVTPHAHDAHRMLLVRRVPETLADSGGQPLIVARPLTGLAARSWSSASTRNHDVSGRRTRFAAAAVGAVMRVGTSTDATAPAPAGRSCASALYVEVRLAPSTSPICATVSSRSSYILRACRTAQRGHSFVTSHARQHLTGG